MYLWYYNVWESCDFVGESPTDFLPSIGRRAVWLERWNIVVEWIGHLFCSKVA